MHKGYDPELKRLNEAWNRVEEALVNDPTLQDLNPDSPAFNPDVLRHGPNVGAPGVKNKMQMEAAPVDENLLTAVQSGDVAAVVAAIDSGANVVGDDFAVFKLAMDTDNDEIITMLSQKAKALGYGPDEIDWGF